MPPPDIYDVFLSHANADKPSVEALARRLREDGLKVFLDTWDLIPGEPWQEALENALARSRACAVVVGQGEMGPWHRREMRVALDQQAGNPSFRVIPVLLPGTRRPADEKLPSFLRQLTWVEFRAVPDDDEAYHRLVSGIRGQAPGPGTEGTAPPPSLYRSMATPPDGFVHRQELDEDPRPAACLDPRRATRVRDNVRCRDAPARPADRPTRSRHRRRRVVGGGRRAFPRARTWRGSSHHHPRPADAAVGV